jgi:predicted ATPase/class 3 adenylate cyclase
MPEQPTGTVTFLFTDIEGSTRLWEDHPDEMRDALANHDAILRASVTSSRGAIVKTTGDGVHAVFASAHDGLEAAVGAQRALTAESWPSATPIRVRMGLHSGEAEYRDGDYFGSATNRAARLMSVAHGGQLLVSLGTAELLSDELPGDVRLLDLGEHRLRDLTRAERVFQVVDDGLSGEFPPLRTLDAFPENLPLQVSSFVGRERDQLALSKALDASRLVTVIGVGGVGKTRLAIQVAAEVITRFSDGAWFCELAAADDPDAMLQVVATALGVQTRSGTTLDRCIVESLRARRLLVVLDNCEHLIGEVAELAGAVLGECPTVWMLATSREALGVDGEQVWPLASLGLPRPGDVDGALTNESVRLFAERAVAARPGFVLGANNLETVAEICRRLDGIPLAIELAAARVSALTPGDIRDLLDERFRLLAGTRRSKVERHQTLRATVDWSYSLLHDDERVVFDRLGVFAGSFDARAAQAVCADDDIEEWDVLEALTGLVARSMVGSEETGDETMRYQLLETLRQYARERLDEEGDTDLWRERHAAHYAEIAEEILTNLNGPDEFVWRSRLTANLDNIRAALAWSLDRANPEDTEYGLRIVAAIGQSSNPILAFADWVERAVPLLEGHRPELRNRVLGAVATALVTIGELDRGRALALEAFRASEHLSDDVQARARTALIMIATYDGDFDEAYRLARQNRDRADERTVTPFIAVGDDTLLAVYAAMTGDPETAHRHAEQALQKARQVGNPSILATALWVAGLVSQRDDPDQALEYLDESAALLRQGAFHVSMGLVHAHRARLRDERGELNLALDALDEGLDYFRRAGPQLDVVAIFAQMSRTFARNGRPEASATIAGIVSEGAINALAVPGTPERVARASAPARTELGDHVYQQLYAHGAAMTYPEAIDYARTQLEVTATTART